MARRHEPPCHELLCEKGALKVLEAALKSAWQGAALDKNDSRVQRAFARLLKDLPDSVLPGSPLYVALANREAMQVADGDLAWAYRLLFALTGPGQVRAAARRPNRRDGTLAVWRPPLLSRRAGGLAGSTVPADSY